VSTDIVRRAKTRVLKSTLERMVADAGMTGVQSVGGEWIENGSKRSFRPGDLHRGDGMDAERKSIGWFFLRSFRHFKDNAKVIPRA
jgi:hypothetical protein